MTKSMSTSRRCRRFSSRPRRRRRRRHRHRRHHHLHVWSHYFLDCDDMDQTRESLDRENFAPSFDSHVSLLPPPHSLRQFDQRIR